MPFNKTDYMRGYLRNRRLKERAQSTYKTKSVYKRSEKRRSILSSLETLVEKAENEAIIAEVLKEDVLTVELLEAKDNKTKSNLNIRLNAWRVCMDHLQETQSFPYIVASKGCGKRYFKIDEFMGVPDYSPFNKYDVGTGEKLHPDFLGAVQHKPEFNRVIAWRDSETELTQDLEQVEKDDQIAMKRFVELAERAKILIYNRFERGWTSEQIIEELSSEAWDGLNYSWEDASEKLVTMCEHERSKNIPSPEEVAIQHRAEQVKFDITYSDKMIKAEITEDKKEKSPETIKIKPDKVIE